MLALGAAGRFYAIGTSPRGDYYHVALIRAFATILVLASIAGCATSRRAAETPEPVATTQVADSKAEMTLDQILFMRPVAGSARQRTPVEGLFLCGPGAHPGGGIAGGAGALAARAAMREMPKKPRQQRESSSTRTSNLEART